MAAARSNLIATVSYANALNNLAVRSPKIEDNVFCKINVDARKENARG